jgi:hypothetical protein
MCPQLGIVVDVTHLLRAASLIEQYGYEDDQDSE